MEGCGPRVIWETEHTGAPGQRGMCLSSSVINRQSISATTLVTWLFIVLFISGTKGPFRTNLEAGPAKLA
jgi:hypothetical protein